MKRWMKQDIFRELRHWAGLKTWLKNRGVSKTRFTSEIIYLSTNASGTAKHQYPNGWTSLDGGSGSRLRRRAIPIFVSCRSGWRRMWKDGSPRDASLVWSFRVGRPTKIIPREGCFKPFPGDFSGNFAQVFRYASWRYRKRWRRSCGQKASAVKALKLFVQVFWPLADMHGRMGIFRQYVLLQPHPFSQIQHGKAE